jgi:DNA polymerase/3'-5' exonuclease PolX
VSSDPTNAEIAEAFQEIVDYLALEGESLYGILAHQKAAAVFREHPMSVAALARAGELRRLAGVGPAVEGKVSSARPSSSAPAPTLPPSSTTGASQSGKPAEAGWNRGTWRTPCP